MVKKQELDLATEREKQEFWYQYEKWSGHVDNSEPYDTTNKEVGKWKIIQLEK